jgi:DNA-binding response OmpR family regulator
MQPSSSHPRLLIVEDEPLIAAYLEDVAAEHGYETVGTASTLDSATALALSLSIDVAVVDVRLHGKETASVADILRQRRVPFVVATGYDTLPEEFMDPVIVAKPYSGEQLIAALDALTRP